MWPIEIAHAKSDGTGQYLEVVTGGSITLDSSTSEEAMLMALGPETQHTIRQGTTHKGRVNVTSLQKDEVWTLSNMGVAVDASFENDGEWSSLLKVTAKAAGSSLVTFTHGTHSATMTINVT
jgi:hypothetical protein